MPHETTSDRLPSLDGWRALSILLVLGSHSRKIEGFPAELDRLFWLLFDGGLGVRFFFVISGFLITWLLLREHDKSGSIDLRSFYFRRCLRIFPVYGMFLLVLFSLQCLTSYHQEGYIWLANLTFTSNFLSEVPWPSAHLWSLAVEEQFYLLWPGLLVGAGLISDAKRTGLILGGVIMLAPLWRVMTHHQWFPASCEVLFTGYSFLNQFDALAAGCLAAFAFARQRQQLEKLVKRRPARIFLAAALLILVPKLLGLFNVAGFLVIPFRESLQVSGMVLLLLQSLILPDDYKYRLLNHPAAIWLGALSYSLYIWQQLFCSAAELFGWRPVWWLGFPGWLLPVFLVATVSYYYLERPLIRWRVRYRKV